jgi:hypothetical protein
MDTPLHAWFVVDNKTKTFCVLLSVVEHDTARVLGISVVYLSNIVLISI